MSLKRQNLTREEIEQLVVEYGMQPPFIGQNPYIASSPLHEILICQMPNGLYNMELLDKKHTEETLQQTINTFKKYAADKS